MSTRIGTVAQPAKKLHLSQGAGSAPLPVQDARHPGPYHARASLLRDLAHRHGIKRVGEHQESCGSQPSLQLNQTWECVRTGHSGRMRKCLLPHNCHTVLGTLYHRRRPRPRREGLDRGLRDVRHPAGEGVLGAFARIGCRAVAHRASSQCPSIYRMVSSKRS